MRMLFLFMFLSLLSACANNMASKNPDQSFEEQLAALERSRGMVPDDQMPPPYDDALDDKYRNLYGSYDAASEPMYAENNSAPASRSIDYNRGAQEVPFSETRKQLVKNPTTANLGRW